MQKLPITLKPGKIKQFLLLTINLTFVIMGINLLKTNLWIAVVNLVLFGFGLVISIVSMLPKSSFLYLDESGILMSTLYRKTFIPWRAVKSFTTKWVVFNKLVVFDLDENLADEKLKRKQGGFPDTYGMSAQKLANLLNEYKNQSEIV